MREHVGLYGSESHVGVRMNEQLELGQFAVCEQARGRGLHAFSMQRKVR